MRMLWMLTLSMMLSSAYAQQTPVAPPPDQLEPAVDTTKAMPTDAAPAPAPAPAPVVVPPKSDRASAPAARASAPAANASAPKAPAARTATDKGPRSAGADRLQLETTDITGNQELPKVLYIVPWRRSDIGDLVGKPPNSLLDEVLQPIDRDVFLRENRYYDAVKPDSAAPGAGAVPGSGDKH